MDEKLAIRRSIFAVWMWPWWVWCVAAAIIPVAYFLSAVFGWYVVGRSGIANRQDSASLLTVKALVLFGKPAEQGIIHSEHLRTIYEWEYSALESLLGGKTPEDDGPFFDAGAF